jgi:small subunit ribosomal protein S6
MANYETVFVLAPTLSEAELAGFMDKTRQTLTKDGGEVLSFEAWGRRKLAHPIGKTREGIYACIKYKAAPPLFKKMAQDFRLDERIIREMTTLIRERRLREKKIKERDSRVEVRVPAVRPSLG